MLIGFRVILAAHLTCSISVCLAPGEAFDVLSESRTGKVVQATLCVHDKALSKERALKYLEEFLTLHPKPFGLLRLVMVSGPGCPVQYFTDKSRQIKDFDDWLILFKDARRPDSPVAEVLETSRGTLLRYRSGTGQIERLVISGENPAIIRKGKSIFELVHLEVLFPAPLFKDEPGGGRRVEVFFKVTGPLAEEDCESITDTLSNDFDLPFLSTYFRTDPFFVFAERFPIVHPLIRYPELPREEEYRGSPSVGCTFWYERRGCHRPSKYALF